MQLRDRFYEHVTMKFLSAVTVPLLRKDSFYNLLFNQSIDQSNFKSCSVCYLN